MVYETILYSLKLKSVFQIMLSYLHLPRVVSSVGLVPPLGLAKRTIFVQVPLLHDNKVTRALNPWDEDIELEGTNKAMHWPSYNERLAISI